MTEFQSNGKHYLAVEVPLHSQEHQMVNTTDILYWDNRGYYDSIELPDGQYSIIGLASEMSEEQWASMMDIVMPNDMPMYAVNTYSFYSAKTAGAALMDSLNLNPETTLIIEKL